MSTPSSNDRRLPGLTFPMKIVRPRCMNPKCEETYFSRPPSNWTCPKCGSKTWEQYETASQCSVCGSSAIGTLNRRHCHRHGGVCCDECCQFFMTLPGSQEKVRCCKGCCFPATAPQMNGNLSKVSRDSSGRETSRNTRYFELRDNSLLYATDTASVWKGFYNIEGAKVGDDIFEEPALGFVLSGGNLAHPLHVVAEKATTKSAWINSIMTNAAGGVGVGGAAFEATEADGKAGYLDLVDGDAAPVRLFFRLRGTELRMSKDNRSEPFDAILLHGATVVRSHPTNNRALEITGPRLVNSLILVCGDERSKIEWLQQILLAMRGGKYGGDLPPVTLRTTEVEGTERRKNGAGAGTATAGTGAAPASSSSNSSNNLIPGSLELREHILVWDNEAIDLRGTTVSVDPNRARVVVVSGAAANPALTLRFKHDAEFSYWLECLRAAAAGRPLPLRKFGTRAPDCSGVLTKVGSAGSLNRRFFRLFDHYLQYSEDAKAEGAKSEFDLLDAEVTDSAAPHSPLGIYMSGPKLKRALVVIAEDAAMKEKWMKALLAAAAAGRGGGPSVDTSALLQSSPGRRTGNLIQLTVTIDVSPERRDPLHPSALRTWHGREIPLQGIDTSSCTIEDLRCLIESVLSDAMMQHQQERQAENGVLFVPGRYIAFRNLNLDPKDTLSSLRNDDDVASLMHRLPDATFLDEIPLRDGDKLVWRDLPALPASSASPLRNDRERVIQAGQAAENNNNSGINSSSNIATSPSRPIAPLDAADLQQRSPSVVVAARDGSPVALVGSSTSMLAASPDRLVQQQHQQPTRAELLSGELSRLAGYQY